MTTKCISLCNEHTTVQVH